jgi:histone arginine demethylase JMJD6
MQSFQVFVPNGWPHLVLNLEQTVAVTHNYASEFGPFERMWEQVVLDEPEFAQRWYKGLCLHRPDLASRIPKQQLI